MKNPNTIKIHKMLKEIYNMTQGRQTQKKSGLSGNTPRKIPAKSNPFGWMP